MEAASPVVQRMNDERKTNPYNYQSQHHHRDRMFT